MSIENTFLKWLYDVHAIDKVDNVVHAERAFVAHSILKWYIQKKWDSQFKDAQSSIKCMRILQKYLKKELDLFWENGIIVMRVENVTAPLQGEIDGTRDKSVASRENE